jgi:hypothetical protein
MRVNKAMLKRRVSLLNQILGRPDEPYQTERDENRNLVANVGTFYLDCAYGGYRLAKMSQGGGARDISPRLPAGQMYDWVNAYIDGIELGMKQ